MINPEESPPEGHQAHVADFVTREAQLLEGRHTAAWGEAPRVRAGWGALGRGGAR